MTELSKLSNDELVNLRAETVREIDRLSNLERTLKECLNSAYGTMGNEYFRFYDVRIAEAITLSAQYVILSLENEMNAYLNKLLSSKDYSYVIAMDTDSMYLDLNELVKKAFNNKLPPKKDIVVFLNKIAEGKLQEVIGGTFLKIVNYLNSFEQKMRMKREYIADRGFWTEKKRYALNALDKEGVTYAEPKVVIKGFEAVRSNVPAVCRENLKTAIKLILRESESTLISFIEKFREEFMKVKLEDILIPGTANNLEKYSDSKNVYGFKTPAHVKGALLYNHLIKKMDLTKKYRLINEGDKIKSISLREPNPIGSSTISVADILPPEFNLEAYIDYEHQFEKSFFKPIRNILIKIGWRWEQVQDMSPMFNFAE